MTKKDLAEYCTANNIRKEHVDEIKTVGIIRADAVKKVLKEEQEVIRKIEHLIDIADKMKNAYFYQAPNVAALRRRYEAYNSVELISWIDGNDSFTAEYSVNCSCKHVYAKGYYKKNGKSTNLKAVKFSLERLKRKVYNV